MANFPPAFNFMMDHEDPRREGKVTSDSGGLTRWGISQRAYPHINIPALTLDNAASMYERYYFAPIEGYKIGDQRIASKVFDMNVNMGVKKNGGRWAVLLLQSALNTYGGSRQLLLKEDGVMGPATIIATNYADTSLLLTGLVELSREYYRSLNNPLYLKGWLARAEKLPPECTSAATA